MEKAKDLIGRKMSIKDLMNLWDEGWGIAVHVDMNDESPYIIEKKSDQDARRSNKNSNQPRILGGYF